MTGSEKARRLERALNYAGDTHSLADVVGLIREGRAQLFENEGGVIVSEVHRFPRFSAIHFWLIAGEKQACLALEHEVLPFGIEHGCTMATATGRSGWGRIAAPTGWRPQPHSFCFYKPLVGEV
jgi:hypothetical protein